jgi:hypothetical protein
LHGTAYTLDGVTWDALSDHSGADHKCCKARSEDSFIHFFYLDGGM